MPTHKSTMAEKRMKAAQGFVMLAHKFNDAKHTLDKILGWRIEEKFDGVRARWHEGKFLSRSKKAFPCPAEVELEMLMRYGDLSLDGELSLGRGRFQQTVSIVRNHNSNNLDWSSLTYHVFDYYDPARAYKDRIDYLNEIFMHHSLVKIVQPLGYVKDMGDIHIAHDKLVKQGGEGLILRNPEAQYKLGRSWDLLKVKKFQDMEVMVVGYSAGEGKHEGKVGALRVYDQLNDKTFKVGSGLSDSDRRDPPTIGEMITIEFFEFTNDGIPRFPTFKGVRNYE